MTRSIYLNQVQRTMQGAAKLRPADVQRQTAIVASAIERLLAGSRDAGDAWRDLADSCNVAETLASLRIGGGKDAMLVIQSAQEALAYMAQEHAERGTWALRAEERIEIRMRLELLRDLHRTQLRECSYAEFERAFLLTVERLTQARAGNAPAGAIVIEGQIA